MVVGIFLDEAGKQKQAGRTGQGRAGQGR